MRPNRAIFVTLTVALLLVSPAAKPSFGASQPINFSGPNENFQLASSYYEYIPMQTISNVSTIDFLSDSNTSVSVGIMNSSQFDVWNNSAYLTNISNSLFHENSTRVENSIHVGVGTFYFVVYAYSQPANVTYNFQIYPVNPLSYGDRYPPQPTGIASFGLYNESGNVFPYSVRTNEVVGVANISSIGAYNATAYSVNSGVYGASLQLNSNVLVTNKDGTSYTYWAQNVPSFLTNNQTVYFVDNVWNNSIKGGGALTNQSIISSTQYGGVYLSNGTDYYVYSTNSFTYATPLDLVLLMNVSIMQNTGILIQMGLLVQRGISSLTYHGASWYDNITIRDANIESAYFYTTGNQTSQNPSSAPYYDTELVFGGDSNGEATQFTQMNSMLGLYYNLDGRLTSFPSYYSFGLDTAEAADNLNVTYSNGIAVVSTGTPEYSYLGASNTAIVTQTSTTTTSSTAASSTSSATSPTTTFPTSTTTTASSTITTSSSISSSSTTTSNATTSVSVSNTSATSSSTTIQIASSSSSSVGGEVPEFPFQPLAIVIFVVLVVASYLALRRRGSTSQ